jgi:NitT/TauT family transport system substrate-binding protein
MMKGADVCALEPERAARVLIDKGYAERYDYALQALRDVPYAKWREYDPEDTVRFSRSRSHQVEPAEDPRPGHRMALPE